MGPGKNLLQHAALGAELVEHLLIGVEQLCAALARKALPTTVFRKTGRPVVGGLAVLVCHLEEEQIGELLEIIAVGNAIVIEDGRHVPNLLVNGGCAHALPF